MNAQSIPDAQAMLIAASRDEHPRVRTEVARGLSFFDNLEAATALLAMTAFPADYWVDYTVRRAALGANEKTWRGDYIAGRIPDLNPHANEIVMKLMEASKSGAVALPFLQTLMSQQPKPKKHNKAMTALADLTGDAARGREVFVRNCTAFITELAKAKDVSSVRIWLEWQNA